MATLDEVISQMSEEDYFSDPIQFIIDSDLRIVSVPDRGVVAGVVGDKNVNRINFQMSRYYNGFDMSKFKTRINYVNANGNPNYYTVTDSIVKDDVIIFSWLVDTDVVAYVGKIAFSVNMVLTDDNGVIKHAFNTSNVEKLKALEGIQVDKYISDEEQVDLISKLEADLTKYISSGINQIQDEGTKVKKTLPADYVKMTEDVTSLKEESSVLSNGNLQYLNGSYYIRKNVKLEQGNFNSKGWQEEGTETYNYYIRTTYPQTFGARGIIVNEDGNNISIYELKNDMFYRLLLDNSTEKIIEFDFNEPKSKYLIKASRKDGKKANPNNLPVYIYGLHYNDVFEEKSALGSIVNIAETYFNVSYDPNNILLYDSTHGLYTDLYDNDGNKSIVCSQFTQACIGGISYENSRYTLGKDKENKPYWWGWQSDGSGVYYNKGKDWEKLAPDYMKASEQCAYFERRKILHAFDANHNDLKPGDLLFWKASVWDKTITPENDYICHTAICLRAYRNRFTFMHSNNNHIRLCDDITEAGLMVTEWLYEKYAPTYYVHLADIPIIETTSKYKLVGYKNFDVSGNLIEANVYIGSIYFENYLEKGFYTVNIDTLGDCDAYIRIYYDGYTKTNLYRYAENQGGISSVVFYAELPLTRIDVRVKNGDKYDVKSVRVYRGYCSPV